MGHYKYCCNDNCNYKASDQSSVNIHIKICKNGDSCSSLELKAKQILDKLDINYKFNSAYKLKGIEGKPLRWDFVICTFDEPMFIEIDGKQHYEPCRFGGISQEEANANFATQQIRDKLKDDFCNDNCYLLLRLKYDLSDEEFEKKINDFINDNLIM